MDFSAIKALIQQNIRTNNNEDITGNVLQQVLLGMIETLGDDAINDILANVDNIEDIIQGILNGGYGDGVYDISANHNGATYADLAAALGTGGANVPEGIRKGGMSVKFVQSSDNKYVQARCMAQTFTTDVTQWQGVDDEPTAGSDNLVKSGGVENKEQTNKNDCYLTSITGLEITLSTMDYSTSAPIIVETDQFLDFYGDIYDISSPLYKLMCVDVVPGEVYHVQGNTSPYTNSQVALYNGANKVAYFSADNSMDRIIYIPSGVNKLYVQKAFSYGNIEKITNLHSKGIDELNNKVSDDELGIEYNYNRLSQISSPSGIIVAQQTVYENKYLTNSGEIADTGNTFLVGVTSVTPGRRYQLKYIGYMTNCGYAFVDSQGTVLKKEVIETSYTAVERNVIAPYDAAELRVSYITGNTSSVLEESNTFVLKPTIWSTKKWTVVGDSLTEGALAATKLYYDYIQEETGIEIANMGASGTGYKRGYEGGNAFYQRISSVPFDTDVITIFGSFNDNPYFGDIGQITDTGIETLCGCVNTCLDNLFSVLPLANVGIVSPTPWKNAVPGQGDVERYVKMLHDICELRGIPYLDLFHCSSLRPWDATYRSLCYSNDGNNGVHPDNTGHKIIAPRFEAFLKTLLLC